jgi:hypothetical protein
MGGLETLAEKGTDGGPDGIGRSGDSVFEFCDDQAAAAFFGGIDHFYLFAGWHRPLGGRLPIAINMGRAQPYEKFIVEI